jgi:hypothetical protein
MIRKPYYLHHSCYISFWYWLFNVGRCNGGYRILTICGWSLDLTFHKKPKPKSTVPALPE